MLHEIAKFCELHFFHVFYGNIQNIEQGEVFGLLFYSLNDINAMINIFIILQHRFAMSQVQT